MERESQDAEDILSLKLWGERIRKEQAGSRRLTWPKDFQEGCVKIFRGGHRLSEIEKLTGVGGSLVRRWSQGDGFSEIKVIHEGEKNLSHREVMSIRSPRGFEISGMSEKVLNTLLERNLI